MKQEELEGKSLQQLLDLFANAKISGHPSEGDIIAQYILGEYALSNRAKRDAAIKEINDTEAYPKNAKRKMVAVIACAFEISDHLMSDNFLTFKKIEETVSTQLAIAKVSIEEIV